MSLRERINRLPGDRKNFLRMDIQEMIFQETQKDQSTQNITNSSQMQLFNYEDGRSNQGETGQHLAYQTFFQAFNE